ncbi:TDP-N-acetylfucosamine:lipid II N-acetylfucosaminyltransferase [Alteromonas sp. M12]|uniref:TDP-N-acetylfucosamine:lipid II N-acetylfucosaminyltransferase n=1 Tax=Alteromonas sp. M12 TaxID=3135644 RepID=UPI00319E6FF1
MRIAHLAVNHKHIDNVINLFNEVELDEHIFFLEKQDEKMAEIPICNSSLNKYINFEVSEQLTVARKLEAFDLLVVHCLTPLHANIINLMTQGSTVIMWKGWGFDYLDLMYDDFSDLLETKSKQLYSKLRLVDGNPSNKYTVSNNKIQAILKINLFCPVFEEEFEIIQAKHSFTQHLQYIEWRYGFDYPMKKVVKAKDCIVKTDSLWLGNSSTITNNHLDYLSIATKNKSLRSLVHYIPMSYGFDNYKNEIKDAAETVLANNFEIIDEFFEFGQYVNLIARSKYMVMNHIRQQAMGNIWIGLLTGCTVFLNEKCPAFNFFKHRGYVFYSINDLNSGSNIGEFQLTEKQANTNAEKALNMFSYQQTSIRTYKLIQLVKSYF